MTGLEGLADLLSWDQGTFHFIPGLAAQKTNIGLISPTRHYGSGCVVG